MSKTNDKTMSRDEMIAERRRLSRLLADETMPDQFYEPLRVARDRIDAAIEALDAARK